MLSEKSRRRGSFGETVSVVTYAHVEFYGPFLDMVLTEYEEKVHVELGLSYAEDARYAKMTRMEIIVKALAELIQQKNKKAELRIWHGSVILPVGADEADIHEIICGYICTHAEF